jgi:hypothetical protein
MKRNVLLVVWLLAGSVPVLVAADQLSEVAAIASQRDAEERYKRLAADVQSALDTQEVLLKRQEEFRQRLEKLTDDVRVLKEEQSRSGSLASRDELRKFVEKLKEVDEKRESDKRLILEKIKELAKLPMAAPVADRTPPRRTAAPAAAPAETDEEPPYVYVVKKNDRLLDIIAEYNDYFQKNGKPKITLEQVLKANPGLKADRLVAGRKVRIPVLGKEGKKSSGAQE